MNQDAILAFADLLALLYHEGRNVRHLIKKSHPIDSKYLSLAERLSRNRYQAWEQIQPLRLMASKVRSHKDIELSFNRYFKLSLDELVVLYAHPGWKGTPYCGNAWLPIACKVKEVRDLLNSGREDEATCLMSLISEMSHNTGKVSQKVKDLDNY